MYIMGSHKVKLVQRSIFLWFGSLRGLPLSSPGSERLQAAVGLHTVHTAVVTRLHWILSFWCLWLVYLDDPRLF